MILSTSHNFLFVHVPKTAGTAMTAALEPFAVTGTRTAWRRLMRRLPLREAPEKAYFRKHETAADMRAKARGRDVHEAIASMQQSSREAARILQGHGVRSCTDVTGFGLAGHLLEMLQASHVSAQIDLSALPVLAGALDAFQRGISSTLHEENRKVENLIALTGTSTSSTLKEILFDPQTAGGLLAGVPAAGAGACVAALKAAGYGQAAAIGSILPASARGPHIVCD